MEPFRSIRGAKLADRPINSLYEEMVDRRNVLVYLINVYLFIWRKSCIRRERYLYNEMRVIYFY